MKKPGEEGECCGQGAAVKSSEGESENGDTTKGESETKPRLSIQQPEHGLEVLSDEDSSIKADYFELEEEPNLMSMVEPADGSLTSQEDWGSLDSDGLFDQSSSGYQWWDFWA
jgi:homeobox-leucine zipper protein